MGRGKCSSLADTKLICLDPVPLWLSSVTVLGRHCKPRADEAQPCEKHSHIMYQDTAPTSPCPPI